MNREGKSYRSSRDDGGIVNGSIVLVTRSEKWSPGLTNEQSNFTQVCLVLECPKDPSQVGREIRLDERKYAVSVSQNGSTPLSGLASTWTNDDGYVEI
jgi:hypothetical protein